MSIHLLRFGPLTLELIEQRAFLEAREFELQPMQFRILAYMIVNAGRDVSSRELGDRLFRTAQQSGSSNVRSQILKLRRRLGSYAPLLVTGAKGWRLQPQLPLLREEMLRVTSPELSAFEGHSVAI